MQGGRGTPLDNVVQYRPIAHHHAGCTVTLENRLQIRGGFAADSPARLKPTSSWRFSRAQSRLSTPRANYFRLGERFYLTSHLKYTIGNSVMATYSTVEVARMLGIHKVTLQCWLLDGKVSEPRRISAGGFEARLWTNRDVERVRRYKEKFYRKGRGRKPKGKAKR